DEKRTPKDQEILRHLADAEPNHRNGNHGGGREVAKQLHDRIEQVVQHADAPEENAENHAKQRADDEADEDTRHADRHVGEDLAAHHHRNGGANDLERRRDEERVENEGRQQLPNQEGERERRSREENAAISTGSNRRAKPARRSSPQK